jgi:hypothetical protein
LNLATVRRIALPFLAVAALVLGGCTGAGYSRGLFQGFVVNKTEAEIIDQMGKPAEIDRKNPEAPVLVYKEKTFDGDNGNRVDPETLIYLRKDDKTGKVTAYDLSFRG